MCKPLFTPPQALHKSAEPSSAPGSRGPQGPIPQPKTPVPHLLPIIQAPGPARGHRLLPLTSSEGPDRAGPGGGTGAARREHLGLGAGEDGVSGAGEWVRVQPGRAAVGSGSFRLSPCSPSHTSQRPGWEEGARWPGPRS